MSVELLHKRRFKAFVLQVLLPVDKYSWLVASADKVLCCLCKSVTCCMIALQDLFPYKHSIFAVLSKSA